MKSREFKNYLDYMEIFMRQAIKEPYTLTCEVGELDYKITINGFTLEFSLIFIFSLSCVMSPYLAGKQLLDEWKEKYLLSILDINMIKLKEV